MSKPYCTTCRTYGEVSSVEVLNWLPPYAVMHVTKDEHVHPITGQEIEMS